MKRSYWALAFLTVASAWPAAAQTPRTIYFYNSALGAPAPGATAIKTAPWGNGSIRNSRTVDYERAPVLEITTRNLQEGARFDLATPVDIEPYRENGFLRLRLKFQESAPAGGPMMMGALPGGPGGPPAAGFGARGFGVGMPGAGPAIAARLPRQGANFKLEPHWEANAQIGALPPFGGAMNPGFPALPEPGVPGMAVQVGPPPQYTPISVVQIIMVREQGVTSGRFPINLEMLPKDDAGWNLLVLPIRDMKSTPEATGPVSRLIVTADAEDTFFMAQAALVIENKEMTVLVRTPDQVPGTQMAELTVKPGPLALIADVEAGAADPAIEWNFDADNVGNLPPAAFGGGVPAVTALPADGPGIPAPPGEMGAITPAGPRAGGPAARPAPTRIPAAPAEAIGIPAEPVYGPRIDARGLTATFRYPNEEQNYRVEVTVRDRSGQKPPVTASLLIRVRG